MTTVLAQEVIRHKRDGGALPAREIQAFVDGLCAVPGDARHWSDAQVAALAMAVCLQGMGEPETVALTRAMADSGERLDWRRADLPGPVLDKHSTGGVGDKVSLMLAPIIAACGGFVPMISGRGLGHTGGTLDKLASWPGYQLMPDQARLRQVVREAGCAIVGASAALAPADRRLYAIRDVTATVESLPLIVGSILSKKLAAGLQSLVMDVKVGNGAFCRDMAQARPLAEALVRVAGAAGMPTRALLTDMNQVLGHHAGNALEMREAIDFLTGRAQEPRLLTLTLALAGDMLHLGGLADTPAAGEVRARQVLEGGQAAECFGRMVAALGGPRRVLEDDELPRAPVVKPLKAPADGQLGGIDTRSLGLVVVQLGGGRRRAEDPIDVRVGLADVLPPGHPVQRGQPVLWVHAADETTADEALVQLAATIRVEAPGPVEHRPVVLARLAETGGPA
ncbi:thymidine phosphorylase [Ideonella sp. DXS29W]|uniref:Thymidine phosphorylase n=1 Tax=Ideonella lacteola TaxID=2984193 RepID=A0ABU9BX33_9BURK